jgi:hypothetical protein
MLRGEGCSMLTVQSGPKNDRRKTGLGIGVNVGSQTDTVPPPDVTSTSVLLT